MAAARPEHRAQVIGSPWPGVHAVVIESGRHYSRHAHATHGIGWMEAGAQRSASGRGRVDALRGDVLSVNPGEVHDGQPLGGPTRRWHMLYLAPEVLPAMGAPSADACADEAEIVQPVIADAALRGELQVLIARLGDWHAGARDDASRLACDEALSRACARLLARHTTRATVPTSSEGSLGRVRERLADAGLAAPSLQELGALCGMSRFQVLRAFEARHGLPPHAWLLQQRAERVRAAIAAGARLSDAAAAAGFADQSHMTRVFTRQFGYTPGAWQRALQ